MSTLSTQPYKGTRDFYPREKRLQEWVFSVLRTACERYGYQPYDGPMLEPLELYAAKSGDELVNEQLYSFTDRGERKVAIRPEMTPTMARMVAAKVNELPRPIRWYSIPNVWRYERPQRGRLREHWQLNVDCLGGDALLADAELLQLAHDIFRDLGGEAHFGIKVNNRRLMDHLFQKVLGLSGDQPGKVARVIDAKAKLPPEVFQEKLEQAGLDKGGRSKLLDFFEQDFAQIAQQYPCEGADELKRLFEILASSDAGKSVVFDPTVMRGLDYYTGTVFEAYDTSPENSRALFGGGRYDNLVGLFGKQQLSGMGFGLGDVGILNFLETHKLTPDLGAFVDVVIALPDIKQLALCTRLAQQLRAVGQRVMTPLSVDSIGNHLKLASKHGARYCVIPGDAEVERGEVVLKDMDKREQSNVAIAKLPEILKK